MHRYKRLFVDILLKPPTDTVVWGRKRLGHFLNGFIKTTEEGDMADNALNPVNDALARDIRGNDPDQPNHEKREEKTHRTDRRPGYLEPVLVHHEWKECLTD